MSQRIVVVGSDVWGPVRNSAKSMAQGIAALSLVGAKRVLPDPETVVGPNRPGKAEVETFREAGENEDPPVATVLPYSSKG